MAEQQKTAAVAEVETIDLGEFKEFDGKDAPVKAALTNWGIAAVIYLVVGKVLDRIIRP